MASTSTLKAIADQLVEETGIGIVIPTFVGTTTTLTLAADPLQGPFTGSRFPINSPILITAGGTVGQKTFVAGYAPSTGVITVLPAIVTGATDAVLIVDKEIDSADRVLEAINRGINNRTARWQKTPLTFVPDGDLLGTTVTDYWTGTAATPLYVTPTFPNAGAAAFDFGGMQRVLQSTTTNATNRVRSNLINVALNSTTTAYQWYFQTAIRVVSGTGDAQFLVWDETNNAVITTNVIRGSENFTHVTTSLGFINIEGTCNLPATCKQISFRLVSSSLDAATVVQMAPLVAYPVDANAFPIPNRVISQEYIGNFVYGTPTTGTSGMYSVAFSEPITTGGLTHHIDNIGDHFTVTFNFRPLRPVYFDEAASDPELTALTSTTTFPLDSIVKYAKYELAKHKLHKRAFTHAATTPEQVSAQSAARKMVREFQMEAQGSDYEPTMMHVYGRVG